MQPKNNYLKLQQKATKTPICQIIENFVLVKKKSV